MILNTAAMLFIFKSMRSEEAKKDKIFLLHSVEMKIDLCV